MKFKNLSVKHLFSWIMAGQAVSIIVITLPIFIFTKQTAVLLAGILLLLCTLIWFVVYTQILAKRLVSFTSDLCRTIDSMISGNEEPILLEEQETQFARISHRLSRLYQIWLRIPQIKSVRSASGMGFSSRVSVAIFRLLTGVFT